MLAKVLDQTRAELPPSLLQKLVGTMSKATVVASMGAVVYGTWQLGTAFVPASQGRVAEDARSALRGAVVEQAVRRSFLGHSDPHGLQGGPSPSPHSLDSPIAPLKPFETI